MFGYYNLPEFISSGGSRFPKEYRKGECDNIKWPSIV